MFMRKLWITGAFCYLFIIAPSVSTAATSYLVTTDWVPAFPKKIEEKDIHDNNFSYTSVAFVLAHEYRGRDYKSHIFTTSDKMLIQLRSFDKI